MVLVPLRVVLDWLLVRLVMTDTGMWNFGGVTVLCGHRGKGTKLSGIPGLSITQQASVFIYSLSHFCRGSEFGVCFRTLVRYPYPHSLFQLKRWWRCTTFDISVALHFSLLFLDHAMSRGVHWWHGRQQGNDVVLGAHFSEIEKFIWWGGSCRMRNCTVHAESLAMVVTVGLQFECTFWWDNKISQ